MRIRVCVKIKAARAEVTKIDDNNYEVRVNENATEGKANKRLIEILSKHFCVSKSKILIVSGSRSREKIVDVAI